MRRRSGNGSFAAFVLTIFVMACTEVGPGANVANRIGAAHHPLIQRMSYSGDDSLDGPLLTILLVPTATEQDAIDLACQLVIPAMASGAPPENFGVDILDSTGWQLLAHEDVECPAG